MKIDIQDVLFWMDAIRNSDDSYRTLESFWKGQVNSKLWLVEQLALARRTEYTQHTITIHGGWHGVLASLLFSSDIPILHITSVDIDPTCEPIAYTMNKRQEIDNKFVAVTEDMCKFRYFSDIVINTSCEHITQEDYDKWLDNVPTDAQIVLKSNNYFDHEEHIRCSTDLDDFVKMSNIHVQYKGELKTPKYTRYMIIGQKYE